VGKMKYGHFLPPWKNSRFPTPRRNPFDAHEWALRVVSVVACCYSVKYCALDAQALCNCRNVMLRLIRRTRWEASKRREKMYKRAPYACLTVKARLHCSEVKCIVDFVTSFHWLGWQSFFLWPASLFPEVLTLTRQVCFGVAEHQWKVIF